jgi:hypothetical protein
MAAKTPLTTIPLGAVSVADDLCYVALTDLARALGGLTEDYRIIGGHMVTVLAARWQLGTTFTARQVMWTSAFRLSWPGITISPAG